MAVDLSKYVDFETAKEDLLGIYQATLEALHICDIALFSGKPESIPPGNQILANFFEAVEPTDEQLRKFSDMYIDAARNVKSISARLVEGK